MKTINYGGPAKISDYTDAGRPVTVDDYAKTAAWQRGYDYARDQLAKNPANASRLRAEADGAIDYTDFDRGINAALRDLANEPPEIFEIPR